MVKVPIMFMQPQLSGRLSSDLLSQEPEARNMEGPMSQSWGHSVGQAWAPGTSLAIPTALNHSRSGHLEGLVYPFLTFTDGTKPGWKLGLSHDPTKDIHMDDESHPSLSLYLPPARACGMDGEGLGLPTHRSTILEQARPQSQW